MLTLIPKAGKSTSTVALTISLDIGASLLRRIGTWAGLTAAEARRLVAALLRHAAACDPCRPRARGSLRWPEPPGEVTLRLVIKYP